MDIERLRQNDIPPPWLVVRAKLIKAYYPHLDWNTVVKLAKETAGLYGDAIRKSVEEYLINGKIRQHPYFKYRNPLTGEYPEREFNPMEIIRQLSQIGFNAKLLKPYFAINPRTNEIYFNFIKAFLKSLYPFSILLCPQFEIMAQKL